MSSIEDHAAQPDLAAREMDALCVDTIRTLAIDAVEKANSGHAGTPMAMAPVVYTLWQRFLRYDPAHPAWPNRDRFVLSCGHASMLLYAMLHLAGVVDDEGRPAVSLDDIENFRQIGSRTPGHPEHGLTVGVEVTTGPLGQGCGNSVGMAIAGRWLAARFNRPDAAIFDYDVYALCSDGDLMEGVASEAASLAGHLGLANLCWIYDSNHITIEGATSLAFSEDVGKRFEAYGWHVHHVVDANSQEATAQAIEAFKATIDRPTLIIVHSIIGYGSPHKQNTAAAHSDALGAEEVRLTKRAYGWPENESFFVPNGVYAHFQNGVGKRGRELQAEWSKTFAAYQQAHDESGREIDLILRRQLPEGWDSELPSFAPDSKGMATREASGRTLNAIALNYPWLLGGSADLAPSTKTKLAFAGAGTMALDDPGGRNFHFGVREHAMGAVINGLALSNLRPFGASFLVFSDYMRPSIRLAALMELPVFYVFTHDSIGVGEDGPTHQPIEHLAGLRAIPGLITLRPADANETVEAYRVIMGLKNRPAALILTRQALPILDRAIYAPARGLARGAYVLADSADRRPEVILIGTGSEVALCVAAFEALKREGVAARVVSMPSWELFEEQPRAYRDEILPPDIAARVGVEQAAPLGWDRYIGASGELIAMRSFGASAPYKDLLEKFGFTVENLLQAARRQIGAQSGASAEG
ncbi:transketolase [Methylocapsa acidiphila]|uniref:transketolase n=1 Tax=Methylocapsa acidiphila TaxID=133552 RepID=UPI0003F5923C|nr:transketolase [Methylocapsa acidiphila]